MKYYKIKMFSLYVLKCNLFLWCKADFLASLLQSSMSHDPSEIILICWFAAQETFLIIVLKTVVLLNIFAETVLFFEGFFDEYKRSKEQNWSETETFVIVL